MPLSTPQSGQTGHVVFSQFVKNVINTAVYANDPAFATLQDMIDYAVGGPVEDALIGPRIALYSKIIFPKGYYSITALLKIYAVINLEVEMQPGAVLLVAAHIDAVFDIVGCSNVRVHGGEILAQNGFVVQNAVWVRQDYTLANFISTRNSIEGVYVNSSTNGYFVNGIRIGNGNTYQNDHIVVSRCHTYGRYGYSQRGIYVHGAWGNQLNITARECSAAAVARGFENDRTIRVSFVDCDIDGSDPGQGGADVAFYGQSMLWRIAGGRAEACDRLLECHTNDSGAAIVSLRDYIFSGEEMSAGDEAVIVYKHGGHLHLDNVTFLNCAVTPYFNFTSSTAVATLRGAVVVAGANRSSAANLAQGSVRGTVEYVQADATFAQISAETAVFTP